jgi:hypothetical protein
MMLSCQSLWAQSPFYQGKTITIIVGYPAGTTHDIWARMIAHYMPKYLVGAPNFIVQPMPGAGSMTSVNYIYGVAKSDGLTLATFNAALYFNQLAGQQEVKFDWPKLSWIGSSTPATRLFYIRADSPFKTIDDFRNASEPAKCGAMGRGSTGYLLPMVLQETLGMKFSIVSGYPRAARSISRSRRGRSNAIPLRSPFFSAASRFTPGSRSPSFASCCKPTAPAIRDCQTLRRFSRSWIDTKLQNRAGAWRAFFWTPDASAPGRWWRLPASPKSR